MDTALLDISSTICGCGPAFVALFCGRRWPAAPSNTQQHSACRRLPDVVSQMVAGTGKLQRRRDNTRGDEKMQNLLARRHDDR